jgi:hypothetical protein
MQQFLYEYENNEFPQKKFLVTETGFGSDRDFNVTEVVNGMPGQQLHLSKGQFDTLVERMLGNGWTCSKSSVD